MGTRNVDREAYCVGNSAFDRDFRRYIVYPSRSDALIASLALSHGASPELMDAIFSAIHDQSFDPSEMTLRRTEDIYLRQSKRIISVATARTQKSPSSMNVDGRVVEGLDVHYPITSSPVSSIVLEATINWIDEVLQDRHRSNEEEYILKLVLKELSLVQRRWTHPARQALGRELFVRYKRREGLFNPCLASPFAGPWTRYFNLRNRGESDIPDSDRSILVTKRVLSGGLFETTLALLGSVKELVLNPEGSVPEARMTASHYCSIMSMPSLKNLTLGSRNWSICSQLDVSPEKLPSEFTPFRPSPSFQALYLHIAGGFASGDIAWHLVWTRDLLSDFFLSSLMVHYARSERMSESNQRLLPLLPRLETLYIAGRPIAEQDHLAWLLSQCPGTLRRLSFWTEDFPSEVVFRSIPRSVEKLSLRFGSNQHMNPLTRWEEIDGLLCQFIASDICPGLRILQIHFVQDYYYGMVFAALSVTLRKATVLCKERHIDFATIVNNSSSFYDYERITEVLGHLDILHNLHLKR